MHRSVDVRVIYTRNPPAFMQNMTTSICHTTAVIGPSTMTNTESQTQ